MTVVSKITTIPPEVMRQSRCVSALCSSFDRPYKPGCQERMLSEIVLPGWKALVAWKRVESRAPRLLENPQAGPRSRRGRYCEPARSGGRLRHTLGSTPSRARRDSRIPPRTGGTPLRRPGRWRERILPVASQTSVQSRSRRTQRASICISPSPIIGVSAGGASLGAV